MHGEVSDIYWAWCLHFDIKIVFSRCHDAFSSWQAKMCRPFSFWNHSSFQESQTSCCAFLKKYICVSCYGGRLICPLLSGLLCNMYCAPVSRAGTEHNHEVHRRLHNFTRLKLEKWKTKNHVFFCTTVIKIFIDCITSKAMLSAFEFCRAGWGFACC